LLKSVTRRAPVDCIHMVDFSQFTRVRVLLPRDLIYF